MLTQRQNSRSRWYMAPYLVALWGGFGGESTIKTIVTGFKLKSHSYPVRRQPKGRWTQHLVQQGLSYQHILGTSQLILPRLALNVGLGACMSCSLIDSKYRILSVHFLHLLQLGLPSFVRPGVSGIS